MADIAGYITEDLKCTNMLTDGLKNIALEARETVISQLATIRELEEEHQVSSAQLQRLMENIGTRSETAASMHKYLTELEEEDRQIAKLLSAIKYQVNTYYGCIYLYWVRGHLLCHGTSTESVRYLCVTVAQLTSV